MIAAELSERADFVECLARDSESFARLTEHCPAWFPRTEVC